MWARFRWLAAVALISGAGWLCGCAAPVPPANDNGGTSGSPASGATDPIAINVGTWARLADAQAGISWNDLWSFAADNVLLVGGDATSGRVFRFDGTQALEETIPQVGPLNAVWGFDDGSAVTVGDGGGVLTFDGAQWSQQMSPTPADYLGVWGADPTNVWIVGTDGGGPVIVRLDTSAGGAGAFEPFAIPSIDRSVDALFDVFGAGGRVFAVGSGGVILEFDAGRDSWRQAATGPAANEGFLGISGVSASNMVAVGGETTGRISVFNGQRWMTQIVSVSGPLRAVWAVDADLYVLGGDDGFVAVFNPLINSFRVESSE